MKTDELQNKINFLLLLIHIICHNISYIFKWVKYKKKRETFLSVFSPFNFLLLIVTNFQKWKKKMFFLTNTMLLQLIFALFCFLIGTNQ